MDMRQPLQGQEEQKLIIECWKRSKFKGLNRWRLNLKFASLFQFQASIFKATRIMKYEVEVRMNSMKSTNSRSTTS